MTGSRKIEAVISMMPPNIGKLLYTVSQNTAHEMFRGRFGTFRDGQGGVEVIATDAYRLVRVKTSEYIAMGWGLTLATHAFIDVPDIEMESRTPPFYVDDREKDPFPSYERLNAAVDGAVSEPIGLLKGDLFYLTEPVAIAINLSFMPSGYGEQWSIRVVRSEDKADRYLFEQRVNDHLSIQHYVSSCTKVEAS